LLVLLKTVFSADKTGVTQRIFALDDRPAQPISLEADSEEEFELVVGRRQVAGIMFLALVVVAVCSGGSYLAGKAISATREAPAEQEIKIEQPPATSAPTPMIEATIVPAPAAGRPATEAPLFANPNPQAIYIQVGAVEKGVAMILAEGLRKHTLDSFVAPGPTGKTFRVLIGPFADAEGYQKARNIVAEIGLDNFARRYQSQ
jgi:cell division septation protein DedD